MRASGLMLALIVATCVACDSGGVEPTEKRGVDKSLWGLDADSKIKEEPAPPPPPVGAGEAAPAGEAPLEEPAEPVREKAEAGSGVQGRTLQGGGYLSSAMAARFHAEQSLEFGKVTHALNLYEAEHGEKPKSHEEFMEKIIEFNQIQLPRLPEGEKYVYDPEKGQLMVERSGQP